MSKNEKSETAPSDVYARITERNFADRENDVRPWMQHWSADNATGWITRPVRHNGQPYTGMNVRLRWSEGMARGFTSPISMTFKQSAELTPAAVRAKQVQWSSMWATLSNVQSALIEVGKAEDDGLEENAWADHPYRCGWPAGKRRGIEPSQPVGHAVQPQCYSAGTVAVAGSRSATLIGERSMNTRMQAPRTVMIAPIASATTNDPVASTTIPVAIGDTVPPI